jgi:hypothetical protein
MKEAEEKMMATLPLGRVLEVAVSVIADGATAAPGLPL